MPFTLRHALKLLPVVPRMAATRRTQRAARRAVFGFVAALLIVNVAFGVAMDTVAPRWRDTEYVERLKRLRTRVAEHPGRPLTVVLGSSRTDQGVRPLILPDDGPLVCNVSQVGAGPLLELLTLQRLLRDGVRPREAIVEFWPLFLNSAGVNDELGRIDPHRLFAADESFVRSYHPNPEELLRLMREIRRTPVWNHRQRSMSQLMPNWLPIEKRLDSGWSRIDVAGWQYGWATIAPEQRARALTAARAYYRPILQESTIVERSARALRELLATCRAHGIAVTLVWLPESSEFRSWYPPQVVAESEAFFRTIQGEFSVKAVNARDWLADDLFADGFHLTQPGAAAFTKRLLSPEH